MNTINTIFVANTIKATRLEQKLTQLDVSKKTGINRSVLSKIETGEQTPSLEQLQLLCDALQLDPVTLFTCDGTTNVESSKNASTNEEKPERIKLQKGGYNVAVAGTGYVGLSLAVLLAQHNNVTAVDIIPEKVKKLNKYISPIQDDYIEKYLEEAKNKERILNLKATTKAEEAYKDADFIIIAENQAYYHYQIHHSCWIHKTGSKKVQSRQHHFQPRIFTRIQGTL